MGNPDQSAPLSPAVLPHSFLTGTPVSSTLLKTHPSPRCLQPSLHLSPSACSGCNSRHGVARWTGGGKGSVSKLGCKALGGWLGVCKGGLHSFQEWVQACPPPRCSQASARLPSSPQFEEKRQVVRIRAGQEHRALGRPWTPAPRGRDRAEEASAALEPP